MNESAPTLFDPTFLFLIGFFLLMYFFIIRPQNKQRKAHEDLITSLEVGDEVVTSGGIVGKIERVLGDDKVDISISENVTVQVVQSTIQSLLNKPVAKK